MHWVNNLLKYKDFPSPSKKFMTPPITVNDFYHPRCNITY